VRSATAKYFAVPREEKKLSVCSDSFHTKENLMQNTDKIRQMMRITWKKHDFIQFKRTYKEPAEVFTIVPLILEIHSEKIKA
jgi:hypothetical protein